MPADPNRRTAPTIGVIILYYRFWPQVRATIDALLGQTFAVTRIVVVDNASGDGRLDDIRAAYPMLKVVENATNGGYAGGMNFGVGHLDGACDYLLFLTHECLLAPDAIEQMMTVHESSPRTGCVGPLLGFLDAKELVFSAGVDMVGPRHRTKHLAMLGEMHAWKDQAPRDCDALDGACLLVRQSAFAEAGPFDEGYFLYFEETDFLLRLKQRGWTVACVPRAVGWQKPGKQPRALWTRNRLRFMLRNYGVLNLQLETTVQTLKSLRLSLSRDSEKRAEGRAIGRGVLGFFGRTSPKNLL